MLLTFWSNWLASQKLISGPGMEAAHVRSKNHHAQSGPGMEAARSKNHQAQSRAVVTKGIRNCQHMASDSGALVQASKTKQDIREALVIITVTVTVTPCSQAEAIGYI